MLKKLLSLSILLSALTASAFNVTFRVDMTQQTDFITPEVNGSFNNWCGNCFQMTDADGDNIWEATTDLAAGTYEYKFSADNWQVDMNGVTGFTTPEVNGTFNGWCGNCTAMFDNDGDNIWSVSVTLQEGTYEYKFSHDNWGGQENLVPGSPCTVTVDQFTNRTIVVDGNITLEPVCWGSCAPCGQSTGPYNVTFAVDMSQAGFAFTTPEVNGSFNNWCGNCAPMSDADGDNIWTLTVALPVGVHTYKFSYDNWAGQEELIPGSPCTLTESGFTNRSIDVSDTSVLPNVCWGSCEACAVDVQESTVGRLLVYPNPANEVLTIAIDNYARTEITVSDFTGRVIWTSNLQGSRQAQFNVSQLPVGSYVVSIRNEQELLRRVVQVIR